MVHGGPEGLCCTSQNVLVGVAQSFKIARYIRDKQEPLSLRVWNCGEWDCAEESVGYYGEYPTCGHEC